MHFGLVEHQPHLPSPRARLHPSLPPAASRWRAPPARSGPSGVSSTRDSLVISSGSESNSTMPREDQTRQPLDDLRHALAREQLGRASRNACRPGSTLRPGMSVGRITDSTSLVGSFSTSSRPGSFSTPNSRLMCGFGDVAIDQQHGAIFLQRHAQREIDARERLAVARQRARDHDQFLRRSFGRLGAERGLQQRALDRAVLVGDLALLVARRQQSGGAHGVAIDLHEAVRTCTSAPAR